MWMAIGFNSFTRIVCLSINGFLGDEWQQTLRKHCEIAF